MTLNECNFDLQGDGNEGLTAVSLFSNCGAGDVGYKQSGFNFKVMAELERRRLDVCLLNHPGAIGILGDLRDTWEEVVETYNKKTNFSPLKLLAACPPCQGMSSARGLRGAHNDADAGSKDKRNLLAVIIALVAKELSPEIIVVENVPEFLAKKVRHPDTNEPVTASNLLIELLEETHKPFPILTDLCDFGIPQVRKRTFLTFIKRNSPALSILLNNNLAPYPEIVSNKVSLKEALASFDLPSLDAAKPETAASEIKGGLHSVPVMSPEKYQMVASIPLYSGKSAWENNSCNCCGFVNTEPDVYCSNCNEVLPKPVVRDKEGKFRLINGFKTSYKRMHADKPASTILTASSTLGSHNTIHPFENRVLSTLECALLQTLSIDYDWGDTLKKHGHRAIREMIGEAVPPKFTKMHGEVLNSLLNGILNIPILEITDKRCQDAWSRLRNSKR